MDSEKNGEKAIWISMKTKLKTLVPRKSSSVKSTSAASLGYLPDELLEKVFRYLSPESTIYVNKHDLKNLFNVSLVSTQWYRVAIPYLYCHLRAGRHGRSARVFATLVSKPSLGLHTKSLDAKFSALTEDLHSRLSISKLNWSEYMLDRRHQSQAHQDAFYKATFSNTLYYLPNLERLNVGWYKKKLDDEETPPWLKIMQRNRAYDIGLHRHWADGPTFSNLKRLDAALQGLPIIELYAIFRLPNLEILYTAGGKLRTTVKFRNDPSYVNRMTAGWEGIQSKVKRLSFYGLEPGPHHSMGIIARAVPHLEALTIRGTWEHPLGANKLRAILSTFMLRDLDVCKFKHLDLRDDKPTAPDTCSQVGFRSAYLALCQWYKVEDMHVDLPVIHELWAPDIKLPKGIRHLKIRVLLTEDPKTVELWTWFKYCLRAAINEKAFPKLEKVQISLKACAILGSQFVLWIGNSGYEANGVKVIVSRESFHVDIIPPDWVQQAKNKQDRFKKAIRRINSLPRPQPRL